MPLEEQIDDPLTWIVVRFEGGRIEPLRFRWHQREFSVMETLSHRFDRSVRPHRMFFSARVTTGEIVELKKCEGDPVWRLSRIQTD